MILAQLIDEVRAGDSKSERLAQVTDAAARANHLNELADHLVGHFVELARDGGATWAEIGSALGVSKQAAQQRSVAGEPSLERLTNRGTIAVLAAQNSAREHGDAETTTLHLLVGLCLEWESIAGSSLAALGVTPDRLIEAINAALPTAQPATPEHRPFSRGMRRTIDLARRRSLRMGHAYVGTEHLLLGLLDSGDQPAVEILTGLVSGDNLSADLQGAVDASLAQWSNSHAQDRDETR